MNADTNGVALPRRIDHYLALLSKFYAQEGKRQLQELIVNARPRIHEKWSSDNWNGGTYGHALYLVVPESLYLTTAKQKDAIQSQIKDDLNKLHNIQNEFVEVVFLETEVEDANAWRKNSGLLYIGTRAVSPDDSKRIWGEEGFRVFLSHKSEVKHETAELKKQLSAFGVSCFVAHEDIHPTKPWQDEIELALTSMDGFIALMTDGFHNSEWTDQEVGFAFARGIPILSVRMGKDPYGFIGKFQALTSSWSSAAEDVLKVLIKHDRMFSAYVNAVRTCPGYGLGNTLAKVLPNLNGISDTQIEALVSAYNENHNVRSSYAFNGSFPQYYGPGLVAYINQFGTSEYDYIGPHCTEIIRIGGENESATQAEKD